MSGKAKADEPYKRVRHLSSFRSFLQVSAALIQSVMRWSCVGMGSTKSVPGIWEESYSAMIICVLHWCLDLPWLHL